MTNGTVKWFSPQMGFGYIAPDRGGADVLVMGGAVDRAGLGDLYDGQKVTYTGSYDPDDGRTSAMRIKLREMV
ncbi:MAG TPA: cold shock domain-containing protein [Alphaproteobacteria bacterium]